MPQSYACLHFHFVFSTKDRTPLLPPELRARLFEYIGGILRAEGGCLLAAGGMPDHVHLLRNRQSIAIHCRTPFSAAAQQLFRPIIIPVIGPEQSAAEMTPRW